MDTNKSNFGQVLEHLKQQQGNKATRSVWKEGSGKIWISLQTPDQHSKMTEPYLYMGNVWGNVSPWTVSSGDVLAEDWILIWTGTTEA